MSLVNSFPSPANTYEIALAELNSSKKSKHEKIVRVFEILDELVPNLGVYKPLMKIIRDQIFESVFSDQYTGSINEKNEMKPLVVERLPYCILYDKIRASKDEKYESMLIKYEETEKELQKKNFEINQVNFQMEKCKQTNIESHALINKLNEEIKDKKVDVYRLEKKINQLTDEYQLKLQVSEKMIENLKKNISKMNDEIKELSIYKNAYDDIHSNFAPSMIDEFNKPRKKPTLTTRKNQILTDITNANKLEEQLLTLMNVAIEEYDQFLEKKKQHFSDKKNSIISRPNSRENFKQFNEAEISIFNQEISIERTNFKRSIRELKNEFDMIVQHKRSLEEKLYLLEIDRETSEYIKRQKSTANSIQTSNTDRKSLIQGLEEHYEPERKGPDRDQFLPQERILSKFSCVIYCSSNGTNWKEFQDITYCESCGDKTFICPHKLTVNESVFELPQNISFIKFVRPKLQYNPQVVKQSIDNYKKNEYKNAGMDFQTGNFGVAMTNYPASYPFSENDDNFVMKVLREGNSDVGFCSSTHYGTSKHEYKHLKILVHSGALQVLQRFVRGLFIVILIHLKNYTFQMIWDDYNKRSTYSRKVQRPFSFERTISVYEQFLAFLHSRELTNGYEPISIVENLYEFFENRYDLDEVKFSAVYDFYTSIYSFSPQSKLLEIFCHSLIGNLDRCTLNYVLYMAEIIDKIDWKETEDVKPLFGVIYPFCDDDELDALTLDYTSFSENKVSKTLVLGFIMNLILNRRDILINEMQFKLSTHQTRNYYMMSEDEFLKAMDELFYIYDEKQTRIYYATTLKHCFLFEDLNGCVPIDKLAHIASYYYLIQIIQDLKIEINDHISVERDKRNSATYGTVDKSHQLIPSEGIFIKMSDIDALSISLSALITKEDEDFDTPMSDGRDDIW